MGIARKHTNGRVTVVMPTYNRARMLPTAIESALAQTAVDRCDIVVVDDGSVDDTRDVVQRYGNRVIYIYQSNAGLAAARNTAIRATDNEFVAFLDDDDTWEPDKTERQLATFAQHPHVVLVAGRATGHYADGLTRLHKVPDIPFDTPVDFAPLLFEDNFLTVPMVMVRRDALDAAGLHDETLRRRQDYHMWTRIALSGPCVLQDAHVADYAIDTSGGLSSDRKAAMLANLHVRQELRRELAMRPDCRRPWRRGMALATAILRDLAYRNEEYADAVRFGFQTLWYRPWRPRWEWRRLFEALLRLMQSPQPRPAG